MCRLNHEIRLFCRKHLGFYKADFPGSDNLIVSATYNLESCLPSSIKNQNKYFLFLIEDRRQR